MNLKILGRIRARISPENVNLGVDLALSSTLTSEKKRNKKFVKNGSLEKKRTENIPTLKDPE